MNRSRIRHTLLAVLVTIALPAESVTGEAIDPRGLSIASVADLAVRANPELVRLQRELDTALERLGWEPYRDDLALSLRGSVSGATLDDRFATGTTSLDLGVEVIPQLTVTGGLFGRLDTSESGPEDPHGASVGVVLDPLADTQRRNRDELEVERVTVELETTARGVRADAIDRLLAAVISRERIPLLESALAIAGQRLEQAFALAERERATAEDVNRASDATRSARQTLDRARLEAHRARLRLAQSLRVSADAIEVPGWEALDLVGYVERIGDAAAAVDTAVLVDATESVGEARVNLESARIEAAATRRFTPELSASAAMTFPGPGYSIGMAFKVRPADWDGSARAEASADVTFAEQSYESARLAKELDLRIARLVLDQTFENLEAAQTGRALVEIDLDEAVFLFDRGEKTALAVSEAELALAQVEYDVWNAHAAVVGAWTSIDLVRF